MITSEHFHLLRYFAPRRKSTGVAITHLTGLDSEALTTGEPFMFCTSDGDIIKPKNLFSVLHRQFEAHDFALFNMKYDSGAILYYLSNDEKRTLWDTGTVILTSPLPCKIDYIPHKQLRIKFENKDEIIFWDIAQFFNTSLSQASKTYLNDDKLDIETKSFTPSYVNKNWRKLAKYCIKDASLTSRLGDYLIAKINSFDMRVTALYSQASVSLQYYQDRTIMVDVWRFWKNNKKLLMFAMDAYEGGKFEVTQKGQFYGYEYDISSAYPYEIARLAGLSRARVKYSDRYEKSAYYGFLRCKVEIFEPCHVPFGVLSSNTRIYPIGEYFVAMTKAEYEYCFTLPMKTIIIDAMWVMMNNVDFPYKEVTEDLYELKQTFKGGDAMQYHLIKVFANGIYGKFCQTNEAIDDEGEHFIKCGCAWNPIHAAVITANTRLRVTELQNRYKDKCLAVHTDSVMLTEKIDPSYLSKGLGSWEYVTEGKGIMIACGCYQLGDIAAFKGFEPKKDKRGKNEDWVTLLKRHKDKNYIPYSALRVESWIEATSKKHFDKINLFQDMPKNINLNADIKRTWDRNDLICKDLLTDTIKSTPLIITETRIPQHWRTS